MKMGAVQDMKLRIKRACIDNSKQRTFIETARKLIFEKGATIDGERVKNLLDEGSYVPTIVSPLVSLLPSIDPIFCFQNAFSDHLHGNGVNFFRLFVIDLLHEFEIGVWKAILTHLLRILIAEGGQAIQHLDAR